MLVSLSGCKFSEPDNFLVVLHISELHKLQPVRTISSQFYRKWTGANSHAQVKKWDFTAASVMKNMIVCGYYYRQENYVPSGVQDGIIKYSDFSLICCLKVTTINQ